MPTGSQLQIALQTREILASLPKGKEFSAAAQQLCFCSAQEARREQRCGQSITWLRQELSTAGQLFHSRGIEEVFG